MLGLLIPIFILACSISAESTVCNWQPDRKQPGEHGFFHFCTASYQGNKTKASYRCDPGSEGAASGTEIATYGGPGPGVVAISA